MVGKLNYMENDAELDGQWSNLMDKGRFQRQQIDFRDNRDRIQDNRGVHRDPFLIDSARWVLILLSYFLLIFHIFCIIFQCLYNNLFLSSNSFFVQYPYFLLNIRSFCSSSVFVYGVNAGPQGGGPWTIGGWALGPGGPFLLLMF